MNNSRSSFDWHMWQAVKWFAYFGWAVGSIFSYIGVNSISHLPWWMKVITAIFAIGINVVEYAWGRMSTQELLHPKDGDTLILTLFGLVAYLYDTWTNIIGFVFMFTATTSIILAWNVDKTLLIWPIFFGVLFAIGPEPMYRYYLRNTFPKPVKYDVQPYRPNQVTPNQNSSKTSSKPGSSLQEYLRKKYPENFK